MAYLIFPFMDVLSLNNHIFIVSNFFEAIKNAAMKTQVYVCACTFALFSNNLPGMNSR